MRDVQPAESVDGNPAGRRFSAYTDQQAGREEWLLRTSCGSKFCGWQYAGLVA